ncbi:MAG: hypothetical protein ACFCUX_06605 [Candidatus Methylacidiphilales bacterium]
MPVLHRQPAQPCELPSEPQVGVEAAVESPAWVVPQVAPLSLRSAVAWAWVVVLAREVERVELDEAAPSQDG